MRDPTCVEIRLEIRVHILVKTPRGNGVTAGFTLQKLLDKPERLACLPEIARTLGGNLRAVFRNVQQLFLTHRIGAGVRLFFCKCGITVRIPDHSFAAFNHCFQKLLFADIGAVCQTQRRELFLGFPDKSFITDRKHLAIVYTDMTDAVIKVVADRKHAMV